MSMTEDERKFAPAWLQRELQDDEGKQLPTNVLGSPSLQFTLQARTVSFTIAGILGSEAANCENTTALCTVCFVVD